MLSVARMRRFTAVQAGGLGPSVCGVPRSTVLRPQHAAELSFAAVRMYSGHLTRDSLSRSVGSPLASSLGSPLASSPLARPRASLHTSVVLLVEGESPAAATAEDKAAAKKQRAAAREEKARAKAEKEAARKEKALAQAAAKKAREKAKEEKQKAKAKAARERARAEKERAKAKRDEARAKEAREKARANAKAAREKEKANQAKAKAQAKLEAEKKLVALRPHPETVLEEVLARKTRTWSLEKMKRATDMLRRQRTDATDPEAYTRAIQMLRQSMKRQVIKDFKVPKNYTSTWQIFLKKYLSETGKSETPITERMQEATELFRALSAEEKAKLETELAELRAKAYEDMKAFLAQQEERVSPLQYRFFPLQAKTAAEEVGKAPIQRPSTAFSRFIKSRGSSGFRSIDAAAEEWRQMSDEDKKPFFDEYLRDVEAFNAGQSE